MKIYCSRRQYNIDDFIGKDIWVKVYSYPSVSHDADLCEYVRILRIIPGSHYADGRDRYEVNSIDANLAEGIEYYDEFCFDDSAIKCSLLSQYTYDELALFEPLNAMTTDELLSALFYYREGHSGRSNMAHDEEDEDEDLL
jgi:hypothetical protein